MHQTLKHQKASSTELPDLMAIAAEQLHLLLVIK
jgi:hypothetical protein